MIPGAPVAITPRPFRFDAVAHEYVDLTTGAVVPHITGMLLEAGIVDDRWFTEESRDRGSIVHQLTADYDLGALEEPESCVSQHLGFLHAHVAAMKLLHLEVLAVEEPIVRADPTFGGRPDRVIRRRGMLGTLEIKSTAGKDKSHQVQTALQAILLEAAYGLPAEQWLRLALYLKPSGRFQAVEHEDLADFAEARRVIRRCC